MKALYGIVDAGASKPMDELLDAYLAGGCKFIQLRMKGATALRMMEYGESVVQRCHAAGAKLLVNDRPDIAAAIGADGVHLGQEDVPLACARALLPNGIIGRSAHDLRQVHIASGEGFDYIAFGPVFHTRSKVGALTARGVPELAAAVKASSVPVVAIGGITIENMRQVLGTGAAAVATISAVANAWQPKDAVRSLMRPFK